MNIDIVLLGLAENLDDLDRVVVYGGLVLEIQSTAVNSKPLDDPGHGGEGRKPEPRLVLLLLHHRAQNSREVADVLGDQEVMLHEAFHGLRAFAVAIIHSARDGLLHIEGKLLFRSVRRIMEVAAHGPKKHSRLGKYLGVGLGENMFVDKFRHAFHPIEIPGHPEERLKVAKAALSFLDCSTHNGNRPCDHGEHPVRPFCP